MRTSSINKLLSLRRTMQINCVFIIFLCIVAVVDRTGVGQETKKQTTQSKQAQIKISVQDGILKLDNQKAVFTDLHVFDGNSTGPAKPQVVTRRVELEEGWVKYPLPIGAIISGGVSGQFWAIYANTVLDFQVPEEYLQKENHKMFIGRLTTPEMKPLAKMYLLIDKPKKMFISPEYIVYTDEKKAAVLKETVDKDGAFMNLRILIPKDSKLTTKVTHGKKVVRSSKDKDEGTIFSISGIKQRKDFIKWQLLDNQGKVVKEQLLAFLLVSAKPNMVEYLIEPSVVNKNSK